MNAAAKRAENKIVKAELTAMGFKDIAVGHGTGTARGWLDISVSTDKPTHCYCAEVDRLAMERQTGLNTGRCLTCSNFWYSEYTAIKAEAKKVTGRTGEYDGNIQVKLTLT
mgnify:CR=1 FL=1